jgi:hypothetical protein
VQELRVDREERHQTTMTLLATLSKLVSVMPRITG